jgi:hypothetical protein
VHALQDRARSTNPLPCGFEPAVLGRSPSLWEATDRIDEGGEIALGGYMELLIVLTFAIGWVVIERVAKRYDKPPRDDPPAKSPDRDDG